MECRAYKYDGPNLSVNESELAGFREHFLHQITWLMLALTGKAENSAPPQVTS